MRERERERGNILFPSERMVKVLYGNMREAQYNHVQTKNSNSQRSSFSSCLQRKGGVKQVT
jgi:hypothetical protein